MGFPLSRVFFFSSNADEMDVEFFVFIIPTTKYASKKLSSNPEIRDIWESLNEHSGNPNDLFTTGY